MLINGKFYYDDDIVVTVNGGPVVACREINFDRTQNRSPEVSKQSFLMDITVSEEERKDWGPRKDTRMVDIHFGVIAIKYINMSVENTQGAAPEPNPTNTDFLHNVVLTLMGQDKSARQDDGNIWFKYCGIYDKLVPATF